MTKLVFGFGLADGMFASDVTVTRKQIEPRLVREMLANSNVLGCDELVIACNISHAATIHAMETRFDIKGIDIPAIAPVIKLEKGDVLLVMSPRGLPRLQDRHEYTDEEIASATFSFATWTVHD